MNRLIEMYILKDVSQATSSFSLLGPLRVEGLAGKVQRLTEWLTQTEFPPVLVGFHASSHPTGLFL